MKKVASIPLSDISRLEIVVTNCKIGLEQTRAKTGADYLLNGGMWNGDGTPCRGLKVDGKLLSLTPWGDIAGYGWNTPADIRLKAKWDDVDNYIATAPLILDGKPLDKIPYDSAQGGRRPRSAMGIVGNSLLLFCSSDAMTPEDVRDELADRGCSSAMMLDGGGSSQCDFDGQTIRAERKVHNWIAVWRKKEAAEPPESEETSMGRYRVTPSIGVNVRSTPRVETGNKVGALPQGTVVEVLEVRDGWGRTAQGWVSMAHMDAVEAQDLPVLDNGITVQEHYIPEDAANRPGGSAAKKWITIHETGNAAKGADAAAHGNYLDSDAGETDMVSWHYTVDDHAVVQHLPDREPAYHAGDGPQGTGNRESIGIEICVNAGGDFARAKANAAALVRWLMAEHGIPIERVVQHNHWSGKDCPYTIRHTDGAWEAFLALCQGQEAPVSELEAAVDKLAAAGLINSPDYWKAGDYSVENVHHLLIKWAGSI